MLCVACCAPTKDRRLKHWLCRAHREARGAEMPETLCEGELLRALVFTFPAECGVLELCARVQYVARVWDAADKCATVARDYAMRKTTTFVRGVPRATLLEMTTALVEFMVTHPSGGPRLRDACIARVGEWYPAFAPRAWSPESERMVRVLEAATGVRDFLLLSDLARAFRCTFPLIVVRLVYAAYMQRIRPATVRWGRSAIQ
jgi:hypothetical protein